MPEELSAGQRRFERVGVLRADFQKELYADSGEAVGQRILANDFSEIFAIGGTGIIRVRHDEEEAHTDFVAGFAGLEVDAGARDADSAAHVVEVGALRIGGTNAQELREFAAAAGATLGSSAFRGCIRLKLFHYDLSVQA